MQLRRMRIMPRRFSSPRTCFPSPSFKLRSRSTARAKALAAGLSKLYDGGGRLMDGDKGAALMLLPGLIPDKFAK